MNLISRRTFGRTMLGACLIPTFPGASMPVEDQKTRRPSITDIEGLLVGHYTRPERPTGCTVVTSRTAFSAGVDVRGGAPGTRETDLLRAENTVQQINAIVLSGGSAFGLDA